MKRATREPAMGLTSLASIDGCAVNRRNPDACRLGLDGVAGE